MRLPHRGRQFERITYHASVTQCLGGLQVSGHPGAAHVAAKLLDALRCPIDTLPGWQRA